MTKDGKPIVDDVGAYNVFMQAFGFADADIAEAQARAGAMKTAEKAILDRRASLLNRLDAARMSNDMDGVEEVREAIDRFNDKVPAQTRITPKTIEQSYSTRRRNERDSVDGITLNKNLRYQLMEEYGQ